MIGIHKLTARAGKNKLKVGADKYKLRAGAGGWETQIIVIYVV